MFYNMNKQLSLSLPCFFFNYCFINKVSIKLRTSPLSLQQTLKRRGIDTGGTEYEKKRIYEIMYNFTGQRETRGISGIPYP